MYHEHVKHIDIDCYFICDQVTFPPHNKWLTYLLRSKFGVHTSTNLEGEYWTLLLFLFFWRFPLLCRVCYNNNVAPPLSLWQLSLGCYCTAYKMSPVGPINIYHEITEFYTQQIQYKQRECNAMLKYPIVPHHSQNDLSLWGICKIKTSSCLEGYGNTIRLTSKIKT